MRRGLADGGDLGANADNLFYHGFRAVVNRFPEIGVPLATTYLYTETLQPTFGLELWLQDARGELKFVWQEPPRSAPMTALAMLISVAST